MGGAPLVETHSVVHCVGIVVASACLWEGRGRERVCGEGARVCGCEREWVRDKIK